MIAENIFNLCFENLTFLSHCQPIKFSNLQKLEVTIWFSLLLLPVYSGLLSRIEYPKTDLSGPPILLNVLLLLEELIFYTFNWTKHI